jgi:large conductance mechanosensitive channel
MKEPPVSFMSEFRQFIDRGNVMDMAVGVIVGGAFTSVVTSLTDNIINPLINLVTGGGTDFSGLVIPGTAIDFGAFLSSVINFLLIALVVFFLVRGMNRLHKPAEEVPAPAPVCPHCLEEVKEGATRCPHCGGEIEGGAHAA